MIAQLEKGGCAPRPTAPPPGATGPRRLFAACAHWDIRTWDVRTWDVRTWGTSSRLPFPGGRRAATRGRPYWNSLAAVIAVWMTP
jgi:hypothetical protein